MRLLEFAAQPLEFARLSRAHVAREEGVDVAIGEAKEVLELFAEAVCAACERAVLVLRLRRGDGRVAFVVQPPEQIMPFQVS